MKKSIIAFVLVLAMLLCAVSCVAEAADGVYTTSSRGRNGMVTVQTTIANGKISAVEVTDHMETNVYTTKAIPAICEAIVENNSYGVDVYAGATWTSYAIKSCVSAAVKEAGGDAAAYSVKPEVVKGEDETVTVDVAVVGAGLSGIMTATSAGSQGATVALIEKTNVLGGCSLESFAIATYPTEEAISNRFVGWLQDQHYQVDTALLNRYLNNSSAAISFIRSYNEVGDFFNRMPDLPFIMPYMEREPVFEDMLTKEVTDKGGYIFKTTTAHSLLTDANGAVCGVVCTKADGSVLTVNAKAVVIATGGYGGNTQLVKDLTGLNVVCGCLTQCDGEGMQMAWNIGAKVPTNLGGLQLHQTLATAQLTGFEYFQMRMPMILGYTPSLLDLTTNGIRFRNEDWVNTATAASGSGAYAGGVTYAMLDKSMIDKLMTGGTAAIGFTTSPGMPPEYKPAFEPDTPWADADKVFEAVVEGGWGYKGATIEELAVNAGIDPVVLQESFDAYQEACATGVDKAFGKSAEHLVAYEEGPFYLVEITYNQLGTLGGLVINKDLAVLNTAGQPIAGLYSVGAEAYNVLWDHHYNGSGDGIGWALTSGYLGGQAAAAYAK